MPSKARLGEDTSGRQRLAWMGVSQKELGLVHVGLNIQVSSKLTRCFDDLDECGVFLISGVFGGTV